MTNLLWYDCASCPNNQNCRAAEKRAINRFSFNVFPLQTVTLALLSVNTSTKNRPLQIPPRFVVLTELPLLSLWQTQDEPENTYWAEG